MTSYVTNTEKLDTIRNEEARHVKPSSHFSYNALTSTYSYDKLCDLHKKLDTTRNEESRHVTSSSHFWVYG